jgi:hypothetical protein
MQRENFWYGFPPRNTCAFPTASFGGHDMTAISMAYDLSNGRFVIAADGLCASDCGSGLMEIKSNEQQKIFPVETHVMSMAYSMSGFAGFGEGLFETIVEGGEHIKELSKCRFENGYEFAKSFCARMANGVEKARGIGKIPVIPKVEDLPAGEQGRLFKFYLLGYHSGFPFFSECRFYHIERTNRIQVRMDSPELSQPKIFFTGSDSVAAMIYGNAAIDLRIAKYKPGQNADALEVATSYIRACSDPAAIEIDPWCRIIGGRVHAAEITQRGFKWLIPSMK